MSCGGLALGPESVHSGQWGPGLFEERQQFQLEDISDTCHTLSALAVTLFSGFTAVTQYQENLHLFGYLWEKHVSNGVSYNPGRAAAHRDARRGVLHEQVKGNNLLEAHCWSRAAKIWI